MNTAYDPPATVFLPHPEHWMDLALCAEVGDDFWFPEKGGSTRAAKQVCRSCEVRAECLQAALEHDERFGIWGGMSERERRRLRRQAAPPSAPAGPRSRFRGVTREKSGKWRARAWLGAERAELGCFADEEEAGRVVAEAEAAYRAAQSRPVPIPQLRKAS